jgi:CRISPR-associated endonuclease Cas3-HD
VTDYLAHSARYGCPVQSYDEHIRNTTRGALHRARAALRYYTPTKDSSPKRRELLQIVGDAASFHDFGKLDEGFQETLHMCGGKSPNHIRHEDAGAEFLSRLKAVEAAGLVSAHHRGLVKYLFKLGDTWSRDATALDTSPFRIDDELGNTRRATDTRIDLYRNAHEQLLGARQAGSEDGSARCTGFTRRLLLSMLVDADHTDTARHYGQDGTFQSPKGHWLARAAQLDRYVSKLAGSSAGDDHSKRQRQNLRDAFYDESCRADTSHRLYFCDAVVGSGKTTAIMAHLLRVAAARRLRRIFVVLPYTNIVRQAVDVYRAALCLPCENEEEVVAEHHHQVDFEDVGLRHLTTLWRSPIVVTTAVQFFETLASNRPAQLRKLHGLAGSAVLIDEAHAALPSDLWPQSWNWLMEWAAEWGGHLVLASGSLPKFWELDEFIAIAGGKNPSSPVRGLAACVRNLTPSTSDNAAQIETQRVRLRTRVNFDSGDDLVQWVESTPGPRLLIVNSVQTAATLAYRMQKRASGEKVMHLSTALTPMDRQRIVEEIKEMLRGPRNWTLVATSLVEAGLDFSFATGFRQRSSTASLLQVSGRVNRNAEHREPCDVWDFDLNDRDLPDNPQLKVSKQALRILFDERRFDSAEPLDIANLCGTAMRMEFTASKQNQAQSPVQAERFMDYPMVAELCRVIKEDAVTVLADRNLIDSVRFRKIDNRELMRNSVRLSRSKAELIGLEPLTGGSRELFLLPEGWAYDPKFLGYMAGWFERQDYAISGGFIV